ncbi:jg10262 [Pararge aegeria aegeria]|uniref:Jg10262 protein n=1 Tax=Pararge aegeria aegeria TaxID=348720 RepID=A0A8S4SCZ5_9NEOP|nr:jg10262 [Pararge aegeria aegeria]
MSDARSKDLIKLRGIIKGKLTIFQNFLNSLNTCERINETQFNELECRLNKLDSVQVEYDKLQTEMELLSDDPEQLLLEREEFDTRYYSLVASARTLLAKCSRQQRRTLSMSESSEGSERANRGALHDFVRLPKISLPIFDGDFQHWLTFRDTFISLIHDNNTIGDINKFHYLKAALKGSALIMIQNLEFTSKNYKIAWQLLSNRYDNERLLINNHINAILDFTPIQKESCHFLRKLIDTIRRNLCALNTLGQPTDHWDTLIIHLMTKKLDSITFREWEEHRNTISTSPTLKQFVDFLTNRADLLETIHQDIKQRQSLTQTYLNTQSTERNQNTQNIETKSKNTFYSNKTKNIDDKIIACPMCKQNHFLFSCPDFRNLDVDTRILKMQNFTVCKNCLRPGHKTNFCKLTHCKYCVNKHNTLLHKDTEQHSTVALSSNINTINKPYILLSTALVNVVGADGNLHPARALLDNGATAHYVTRQLCERLGLERRNVSSTVTGINNQVSHSAESCNLSIESSCGDYKLNIECYVLPQITNSLPSCNIDIQCIKLPPNIQLADPSFHISSPIDILMGADVFWDVICSNLIDLGKQRPKLQQTKLGWLVSGTFNKYRNTNTSPTTCLFSQNNEALLTRFWELESINPKYSLSLEEQACEKSFAENTWRDNDGRFIVTIPLKESPDVLGDSFQSAKNRFLALERRFQRNPILKKRYLDFMTEYENLGHMSDTSKTLEPSNKPQNRSYYLFHHGIVRESSTTTKLRVVFNGSSPSSNNGKTFNSIQMVGPVVQDDLISILLRFRQHKYVVSGDIEKMYRAILVEPSQRSLQQILFRFNPSEKIRTFTLNTVTYGTASAPYLATKCLVSLAEQCFDPDAKTAITRDFYVDDFLSGGDSIQSMLQSALTARVSM